MKILHATTFLQGGAGRVIADLAVAQRMAGHDVAVVTSATDAPGYGNYAGHLDRLARARVSLHLVDSLFVRDYAANLGALEAFDAASLDGAPDIIHAHAAVPGLMALVFAASRREPIAVIETMHGWGLSKTAAQAEADVRALARVHRVIVPSRHSAALLTSLGVPAGAIGVIPYGVGPDSSVASGADLSCLAGMDEARNAGRLVVVAVGTVGARKNQQLLVEAIAALPDPRAVHAVIVGDGDLQAIRDRVRALRIDASVTVQGYSAAARRIAAAADVLVLPSRSEGQPLAVLEAFCDGTLVVASDIPELAELIDDGQTGELFRSDDVHALSSALARVRAMSADARGAITARALARHRLSFSLPAMERAYNQEYASLVPDRRRHEAAGVGRTAS